MVAKGGDACELGILIFVIFAGLLTVAVLFYGGSSAQANEGAVQGFCAGTSQTRMIPAQTLVPRYGDPVFMHPPTSAGGFGDFGLLPLPTSELLNPSSAPAPFAPSSADGLGRAILSTGAGSGLEEAFPDPLRKK